MNQPDRLYLTYLPPEESVTKVHIEQETKMSHASNFRIEREDHSLGNLLRMQLLRDPAVIFAGYSVPHPLDKHIIVKVQTRSNSNPKAAMLTAIESLSDELNRLQVQFAKAMETYEQHTYQ